MEIRLATNSDLMYILNLAQKETNSIGFIPKSRYSCVIATPGGAETLHVAEENNDLVGFVYAYHNTRFITKIQQIAIQEDARRAHRAKALVKACVMPNDCFVALRCGNDLEANKFWQSIGFGLKNTLRGGQMRGRMINVYSKCVGGLWGAKHFSLDACVLWGVGKIHTFKAHRDLIALNSTRLET